ncbi:MAG: VTT domain-containing protein [Nanoarchaeota archaeon]
MKEKIKSIIALSVVIALFIVCSLAVQQNIGNIQTLVREGGNLSIFIYIFIVIVGVVIAPISAFPLLAVASNTWGWFAAGVYSIISWTIGASIAFVIARQYGIPLVQRFIPMKKLRDIEKTIPAKNFFWWVVFLRMFLPVDVLSYALGLFSRISFRRYFFATLIGVAPFGFVFAYIGTVPPAYQIFAFISIFLFVGIVYYSYIKKSRL